MTTEGFVDFRGHKVWYRAHGDLSWPQTPLLCLHGGPGGTSDAFAPLADLTSGGRPVVVYDQLGCGRSDRPNDPALWTIPTFLDELRTLREQLHLNDVHLLGHSWGGMLALEYLLTKPDGVRSVVLSDTLSSTRHWCAEGSRLIDDLPPNIATAIRRCERSLKQKSPSGKTKKRLDDATITKRAKTMAKLVPVLLSGPVTAAAVQMSRVPALRPVANQLLEGHFGRRHGCRLDPMPIELLQMFAGMNRELYEVMWGPGEVLATGTLKDWDVTPRLGEIDVPTLIASGRYDESTPAQNEVMRDGIAGSEWVVFENSSHTPMFEEREAYREAVSTFLAKHDAG